MYHMGRCHARGAATRGALQAEEDHCHFPFKPPLRLPPRVRSPIWPILFSYTWECAQTIGMYLKNVITREMLSCYKYLNPTRLSYPTPLPPLGLHHPQPADTATDRRPRPTLPSYHPSRIVSPRLVSRPLRYGDRDLVASSWPCTVLSHFVRLGLGSGITVGSQRR